MADKKKDPNEKPERVQFPRGSTAAEIAKVIRDKQNQWAKENPAKAHELYPEVYDENGKRIKPTLVLSQPADRSLEAWKKFIDNTWNKLSGGVPDDSMTEQDYIDGWKEFWSNADEKSKTEAKNEREKDDTK